MPYGFNDNKTKIEVLSNSLVSAQIKENLLDVSYMDSTNPKNRRHKVYYSPDNPPANPCYTGSQTFLGVWDYIWFNAGAGMVEVNELYPVAGRVWRNLWMDGGYSGWSHHPDQNSMTTVKIEGLGASIDPSVSKQVTFTFGSDKVKLSGYAWLGVVGTSVSNVNCGVISVSGPDSNASNTVKVTVRNFTDSVQTVIPTIWCLYTKEV